MMQAFCQRFADDGIAVLGGAARPRPETGCTSLNDSRNFHAHIVYSVRPS